MLYCVTYYYLFQRNTLYLWHIHFDSPKNRWNVVKRIILLMFIVGVGKELHKSTYLSL